MSINETKEKTNSCIYEDPSVDRNVKNNYTKERKIVTILNRYMFLFEDRKAVETNG